MYDVIGYEDRMPQLYAAGDLMITRAGASTIAELAATGTPAVVVPWPGAAENHQVDNARTS
jgi:UDP-N-acetylglucosamine--N-acetylmuramyl-(pentapeptide) pyrophosphoryl-undecaprenol N-acetylglucosamine transferase